MASISSYQQAWKDANARGDKAGMDAAHKGAEAIRAGQGYSGGADGSQRIPVSSGSSSSSGSYNYRDSDGGTRTSSDNYDYAAAYNAAKAQSNIAGMEYALSQRGDKLGGTDAWDSWQRNAYQDLQIAKAGQQPAQGVIDQYRQDVGGYMDSYAQQQAAIRAEQQARIQQNLANLDAQKPYVQQAGQQANSMLQQNYYSLLNPNSAAAEQRAAMGLSNSGLTESSAISANNSYMGGVNANQQNVENQLAAIELAKTQAQLTGDIATAQQLQSYYDTVLNAGMQSAGSLAQLGQWGVQNSQNQNQQGINNAFTQAGLTGQLNGKPTMAGQQLSYTIEGMSLDNQLRQFELLLQKTYGMDQMAARLEAQKIANQGAQAGNAGQLLQNEYQRLYNQYFRSNFR